MLRDGSADDARRVVEELRALEREGRITAGERRHGRELSGCRLLLRMSRRFDPRRRQRRLAVGTA
jgi:hypothetical protein